MIEFAFVWALLLLAAPLFVYALAPPKRRRNPALRFPFFRRITDSAGAEARQGSSVVRRTMVEVIAACAIWVLLVVALSRPERIGDPIEREQSARDLVIAIDLSGSMDERDFAAPDGERMQRLEAVKQVVGAFVEDRAGDRIGLVVFGTRAFVQAPFTEDLQAVGDLLAQTEVGMAGPHTAIGDAIGLSIRLFEASEVEDRLLILLSDGADTGSRMTPLNAAGIAASRGVEIYTIGVGDPAASGDDRVDLAALENIAARTGGQFFFAGDTAGLAEVYNRIEELAPRRVETFVFRPREPLAPLALGAALLIGMLTLGWLQMAGAGRRTA